jgi:hypothetical protein
MIREGREGSWGRQSARGISIGSSQADFPQALERAETTRRARTAKSALPCSRSAFGSGLAVLAIFSELKLLLALVLPGVEFWVAGPLLCLSDEGSRALVPLGAGICEPAGGVGPCDEPISRVAGGRAAPCCCLFFFPKRNDMATGMRRGRRQGGAQRAPRRIRYAMRAWWWWWWWWRARRRCQQPGAGRQHGRDDEQRGCQTDGAWAGAHMSLQAGW